MRKIFNFHLKNLQRKSKYSNANILKALKFCDCRVPNQQLYPCKIFLNFPKTQRKTPVSESFFQ